MTTIDTTYARVLFFYDHAGWSYDPKTETEQQGRRRCAASLAAAESRALDLGVRYEWTEDPHADRSGIDHQGPLWGCVAHWNGDTIASLGGIDLGENGSTVTHPYARVIEAELALEGLPPETRK